MREIGNELRFRLLTAMMAFAWAACGSPGSDGGPARVASDSTGEPEDGSVSVETRSTDAPTPDVGGAPELGPEPSDATAEFDAPAPDASGPEVALGDASPEDVGLPAGDDVHAGDTSSADAVSEDISPTEPDVCEPDCGDRECDDDGCGGTCGTCPTSAPTCIDGYCVGQCTPVCGGAECGEDGCDGVCGTCAAGSFCNVSVCDPGTECAALIKCSNGCGADPSCLDECYGAASLDGLMALTDLQVCLLGECSGAGNTLACTAANCLVPYTTCFAGTLGSGNCSALRACNANCGTDSVCINACTSQATFDAVGLYLTYVGCLATECPAGSPVACYAGALAGACKPLVDSCEAQP